MSNCINNKCRRTMIESWLFCPICGTDNRPPKKRTAVLQCKHINLHGAYYCAMCGLPTGSGGLSGTTDPNQAGQPIGPVRPWPQKSKSELPATSLRPPHTYDGWGRALVVIGVLFIVYFFFIFDPTVEVARGGMRVNNIGLMADRQNGLLLGIAMALSGLAIILYFASQNKRSKS